jgi:hypothetical protein
MPPGNASSWRAGSRRRKSMSRACAARAATSSAPCPWMTPCSVEPWRSIAMSGARCRAASAQSGNSTPPSRPYRKSTMDIAPTRPRSTLARNHAGPIVGRQPGSAAERAQGGVHVGVRQFGRTNPRRWQPADAILAERTRRVALPRRDLAERTRRAQVSLQQCGRTNPRGTSRGASRGAIQGRRLLAGSSLAERTQESSMRQLGLRAARRPQSGGPRSLPECRNTSRPTGECPGSARRWRRSRALP